MTDVIIKHGTVVDGTGGPARRADVAITDGRITAISDVDDIVANGAQVIDADGLVVAPGFVDLHTHFDAQLMWDPMASPSPLHGVTTVFGGNCGFSIAPVAEPDIDYVSRLMSRVEGIPLATLREGTDWEWRSFGEFLDRFEGTIGVNAGFLAGHSTIRRVVMGDRCASEPATEADLERMEQLLDEALAAGALGFSTSQAPTHNDGDGHPVPSRSATPEEMIRLAGRVRAFPGTQLEAIFPGSINGFTDEEIELMAAMSAAADRPLNWNVLGVAEGGYHDSQLDASTRAAALGGRIVALTLPMGMSMRLNLRTGMIFDGFPGWRELLYSFAPEERATALRDPDLRRTLNERARSEEAGMLRGLANWKHFTVVEGFTDETRRYEGRTIGEIAQERDAEPFDVLCDIAVADDLRTGLVPNRRPESEGTWQERARVWRDPRAVIGGSDAGAHLDMMSGSQYSTVVIGPAVRDRNLLSLEEAVRLLSDVPARLYGLRDRGRIETGWHADLVLFDPERVGPGPERTRDDLPAGESRIVSDSEGVEHVLVNGVEIVRGGEFTDTRPGRLIRAGRDTDTVTAS